MRFLELRPDGVGAGFTLHPRVTLLSGLDPAARVALVGFVHSVAAGETFDWAGTVDVHGVHTDLASMLDLVGSTADAALIVEATSLVGIEAQPEATPEAAAHAAALADVRHLEDDIAGLAEELGAAGAVRREMKVRLENAEARRDPSTGRRLDLADGDLGRAARLADRPDPWTGMSEPQERVAELETLIARFDEILAELPSGDRAALAAASTTARASIGDGDVVCPEAAALAEAWDSLHQRLEGLESRVEATGGGTEAVAARLDAARAAARAAEDAAVPRAVGPEEVEHLEHLHERVIELEGKTGRSVRKGAAKRDFEQAQQDLDDALDEIGYPTWAAFRMGNGMASVKPEHIEAYDRARTELESAEIEWAELMARLERDTDLQSVLNAIETALDHATALLGSDPYAGGSQDDPQVLADLLRERTVPAASVAVERNDAFEHLRVVLDECGAPGHSDLSADRGLLGLAETWLRVLTAADEAAVRTLRDRERAAAELKELILLGAGQRVDRLDQERSVVYAAEAAVADHRDALLEIARVRLELHMLVATELAIAEEHDAKAEALDAARVQEGVTRHQAEQSAGGPVGVEAIAARIPRGDGGPIPLVVLMGDAPIQVLDVITDLPADVQIIVMGDTPGMADYAEKLGGTCLQASEGLVVV
ncbi:MAG: hypothetical protein AAGE98_00200 [Actinomycetota bacterium]